MKKLLVSLLVLAMLLPLCGLSAAEDAFTAYSSDFSEGLDGWYPRSADGAAELAVTDEGAILITGRTAAWNSPGRDFPLVAGHTYHLSVEVCQTAKAGVTFIVSAAHSKFGLESYENIVTGPAAQGEWTKLEGVYMPAEYDNYILYVETSGDGTVDFAFRNFTVTDQAAAPAEAREEEPEAALPSLKEIYADAFDIGICVNRYDTGNRSRMALAAQQFSIVTAENEMKPDSLIDVNRSRAASAEDETAVVLNFSACTPMFNWAQANGIKVHGHTFVWHSQTPEAIFHERYDSSAPYVSREVMLARLENFMRGVFEWTEANYPGVLVSYDVCNEVIDDGNGALRKSNWRTVIGDDYVARAFEIARRCAPAGVKLYLNDYNTCYATKLNGIRRLLNSLVEEGNIDGYGFQMHHSLNTPSVYQIKAALANIAQTGLSLRVSEMDIGVTAANDFYFAEQAKMYRDIMDLLLGYADQVDAVQVWGLSDDRSWRSANFPLLFDAALQPKPAFWALADPAYLEAK